MNDKLKKELNKTRYRKPKLGVLFGWILAILFISFFFFVIPPFSDKESAERTLPRVREVVRLDLDKNWSEPVSSPPGKCIWYEWFTSPENLKLTAQKKTGNGWEYVDLRSESLGHTNRFRATYDYSYMYYEVRNAGDCHKNMRNAPKSQITVQWKLKNFWSYPQKIEKGSCIKWWAAEDQDYAVNVSHTWGSDQFYAWNETKFVEPESSWKFFKIRFGGRNGTHPTVFSRTLPAGQCRE